MNVVVVELTGTEATFELAEIKFELGTADVPDATSAAADPTEPEEEPEPETMTVVADPADPALDDPEDLENPVDPVAPIDPIYVTVPVELDPPAISEAPDPLAEPLEPAVFATYTDPLEPELPELPEYLTQPSRPRVPPVLLMTIDPEGARYVIAGPPVAPDAAPAATELDAEEKLEALFDELPEALFEELLEALFLVMVMVAGTWLELWREKPCEAEESWGGCWRLRKSTTRLSTLERENDSMPVGSESDPALNPTNIGASLPACLILKTKM